MIRRVETTEDGWTFRIDKTGQLVRLTYDQARRMREALRRAMREFDKRNTPVLNKWREIKANGFSRRDPEGDLLFGLQASPFNAGEYLCLWGAKRNEVKISIERFIETLPAKERVAATKFFQRATKGKWSP